MAKEIILAEHSGFCFGVKKAIEKTEALIEAKTSGEIEGRILTCGQLIHNRTVTNDLERRGVSIIDNICEAEKGDVVVIRSHGAPKLFFDEALERDVRLEDATCPFVSKIQRLAENADEQGKQVIIVGDISHPEVEGINGWCGNHAIVIGSEEEVDEICQSEQGEKLKDNDLFIVCQTTIRKELLDGVIERLCKYFNRITVNNTICNATGLRQESCARLASQCDAMIIVGGKNSSNSQKLYQISKKKCKKSYFIEKKEDLPLQEVSKCTKIGIAAGASTPESAIKEVIAEMSESNIEMNMEAYMEDIDKSLRLPRLGEIVNGKVIQVTDKEVIVNMGCKKDGVIPAEEVTLEGDQKLTDLFREGDEIQAKVVKTDDGDGVIRLSRKKMEQNANWEEISEALENKSILKVKVVRSVNGGVIATYKEVSGFIPLSQLSDRYVESADEFIGKELDVRVTRVEQRRNRAVFSHKAILVEEKQKAMTEAWENLHVDDVVEGTVMRFTDYGAFIDLGGIDGLLHISEISWGKLKHPKEVLQIGDKVNVKILSMNDEKGKISLGLKQTTPEPWSVIDEKYKIGETVTGKVVQIKEYGAFVELEPGLDGLVHISEVAHKRVSNIADEISVGQVVDARILDIDMDRKRISLSIKQTTDAPEEDEIQGVAEDAAEAENEPEEAAETVVEEVAEKVTEEPTAESIEEVAEDTAEKETEA